MTDFIVIKNTTCKGRPVKAGTRIEDISPKPSGEWVDDAKENGVVKADFSRLQKEEAEKNTDEGPGFIDDDGNFVALKTLTVPKLKEIAKDAEIDGFAQMNKEQLISALAVDLSDDEGLVVDRDNL